MTKKIVFGAALALVIVGLAAPSASAACNPPRTSSSFNTATQVYAYFIPSIAGGNSLVGRIYSGITDHTGTCNTPGPDQNSGFFYFSGPGIGFNQNLGDGCVAGCPAVGSLSLQVTVTNPAGESQTLNMKATENIGAPLQYDFSTLGNLNMGSVRPRVQASTRTPGTGGGTVNLNLNLDAASAFSYGGAASDITGYNLVSAPGANDPGSAASAYTFRTLIPAAGGTASSSPLTVDCTNINQDQWVATQIVTTAGASNQVSGRTRVKCNPALANPKYNVVPKKGMGTGTSN